MAKENSHTNGVGIARVDRHGQVALIGEGIEIRREGKPVESVALAVGSVYLVVDCSSSMAGDKS